MKSAKAIAFCQTSSRSKLNILDGLSLSTLNSQLSTAAPLAPLWRDLLEEFRAAALHPQHHPRLLAVSFLVDARLARHADEILRRGHGGAELRAVGRARLRHRRRDEI